MSVSAVIFAIFFFSFPDISGRSRLSAYYYNTSPQKLQPLCAAACAKSPPDAAAFRAAPHFSALSSPVAGLAPPFCGQRGARGVDNRPLSTQTGRFSLFPRLPECVSKKVIHNFGAVVHILHINRQKTSFCVLSNDKCSQILSTKTETSVHKCGGHL